MEILIGKQQKAYIDKNNIGSCILNLLNLMKHVNKKKIPAIILLIDFKKAFDSINHRNIQSVLTMYGFGPCILNWINNFFFFNREACILMKGYFSERILLRQEVPQGDIISPYVFILSVETLLIKINYTKYIKGIVFSRHESRSETFADDTSLFMERKDEYLRYTMKCIAEFSKISGLKCNIEKTKVIPIGNFDKENKICQDINLTWEDDFILLGFYIDNKLANLKQNQWIINTRVKNLINRWKLYYLTIHGCLTMVKSILLAQYTYVGSVMDILDEKEMNEIQNMLNHFLEHNEFLISSKKSGFQKM